MARRELLMKAYVFDAEKHDIGGWYVSEKLDGGRAFWDGGLTRDVDTAKVPWASVINPKTGQPKTKIKPKATGLWSRYGNPIMAPDWFLNRLPACPLDGELWAGRGNFQKVMSTIRKDKPVDSEWEQIQLAVFGSPDFTVFAKDGEIKNTGQHTNLRNAMQWVASLSQEKFSHWLSLSREPTFSVELANLNEWVDNWSDSAFLIPQTKLPEDNEEAINYVMNRMAKIIPEGGEGLFLRAADSVWEPKKSKTCLKVKGILDAEGIVTGFTAGRETNKGSKLLGKIGALVLDFQGKRLELSGLTDEERAFDSTPQVEWATKNPGEEMPPGTQGRHFKVGDEVSFLYRELSKDGVPKEARYFRKRNER
jgi:DNA ligase-1